MNIFFQHVGMRGGSKHFPLSIGTPQAGLRNIRFDEIEGALQNSSDRERLALKSSLFATAPDGFQAWGLPSGAKSIIREVTPGDWMFLLESDGSDGRFYYAGQILARPPAEQFALSHHLWGESKFPIVVFMRGKFIDLSWRQFCVDFGFKPTWKMQGMTYRLGYERIKNSIYGDENTVIERLVGSLSFDGDDDPLLSDEADFMSREGRQSLRQHLVRERDPELVRRFKRKLDNFECSVCRFDFERSYGAVGKGFIEAHHVEPLGLREGDTETRLKDLRAVCSNCHRMLHRRVAPYSIEELSRFMDAAFTLKSERQGSTKN